MAELGTVLSVIAFADQCLKYGNKFVRRCKNYLHAEEEAAELLLAIRSNWVKMETQIEIVKKIAPDLNNNLRDMQSQVLSQLEGKLKTASLVIEQLMSQKREDEKEKWEHDDRDIGTVLKVFDDMRISKKAKYAIKKDTLYAIVDEIEKWQARYDPTWILIMQMSISNIDAQLDQEQEIPGREQIPIIMAAKGIRDATRKSQNSNPRDFEPIWIDPADIDLNPMPIPESTVMISTSSDQREMVLIDTMKCGQSANLISTTKAVRKLARILEAVDPSTFGLLKCRGVIKDPRPTAPDSPMDFKFIFSIPKGLSNPQSLRAMLLSEASYRLDERLALAKKITSSILFVHTVQFVHKNIRPETIIVFQNDRSKIGAPFLAGFEQFRLDGGQTMLMGDDVWYHNLYRHPTRQGTQPEVFYQMQHDIYSLGVVLLEIGLWTSFVLSRPPQSSISDLRDPSPLPNAILSPPNPSQSLNPLGSAIENKESLEQLAQRALPLRLGRRYTDIVLLCLRCLDPGTGAEEDGKGFGVVGDSLSKEEFVDEDGVVIGVRFIENVLEKMLEITI